MSPTGDDMTIFSPESGEEQYLVDGLNEVHDLRRGRKKTKKDNEEDPSEELEQ